MSSLIALIIINEKIKVFYVYSPTWNYIDSGGFESEEENDYYNKARVSLYFIFSFLYLFYLSINRSIPMPDELFLINSRKNKLYDELNNIDNEKDLENEEISKKNKKEKLSSNNENSEKNEENNKQYYDDEEVDITIAISWKKRAVFIKYLLCLSWIIIKNFYIHLNGGIIIKSIIIIINDTLTEEIILKFIFKEALLAAPVLVLNKIMKSMTLIELGGVIQSMIIYIIATIIDSILVIFIYPSIDKFEFFIYSKIHLFKLKYINKFFFKLINKIVIINNYLYNEDYWVDEYVNDLYKYLNKKDELSLEQILRINFTFSIKLMSIIFNPIIFIIFYYFKDETKIKEFLSLKEDKEFLNYFLISLCLLIPEIALQIILINIIQIYYKMNINDYLKSCYIRYISRESNFINMRDTMELNINKFWRSLDSFLFSEQFFLNLFLGTSSLLLFFIGFIILSFYSYNPLGEPYLIFIVIIFFVYILVLHILIILFKFIFGIFAQNNPPNNNRAERNEEILEMVNNKENMKKLMTSEIFRNKFVKINKIWMIENLNNILDIEENDNKYFEKTEKKELESKLKKIYQDALNYEYVEKEIQHEKELIKKDLQLMPYNQDNIGDFNKNFGIRLDISDDSDTDLPFININNKIKKLEQLFAKKENLKLKKRIIEIAKIWKNKAKEILKFKKWSIDIIKKVKKNKCERCSNDFILQVYQNIPFEELVEEFKKSVKGEKIGIYKWKKFFEKNQIFITLCTECGYIRNSQMIINKYHISDNSNEIEIENIGKKKLKEKLKKKYIKEIAYNWLYLARSQILKKKIQSINKNKNKK